MKSEISRESGTIYDIFMQVEVAFTSNPDERTAFEKADAFMRRLAVHMNCEAIAVEDPAYSENRNLWVGTITFGKPIE